MFTLSEKVKQRRILVKPCFEDFDRQVAKMLVNVAAQIQCMCVCKTPKFWHLASYEFITAQRYL